MKYIKPEFDVTIYEVEDILTASNSGDIQYGNGAEGGDEDWGDFPEGGDF